MNDERLADGGVVQAGLSAWLTSRELNWSCSFRIPPTCDCDAVIGRLLAESQQLLADMEGP